MLMGCSSLLRMNGLKPLIPQARRREMERIIFIFLLLATKLRSLFLLRKGKIKI
jgi:hypothetical protein